MEKYIKPNVEEIEVDEPQIFCDDSEAQHVDDPDWAIKKIDNLLGTNETSEDELFGFEEGQEETSEGFIGEEEVIDIVEEPIVDVVDEPIIEQEPIIAEEIIVEEPVVEDIPVEDIIE